MRSSTILISAALALGLVTACTSTPAADPAPGTTSAGTTSAGTTSAGTTAAGTTAADSSSATSASSSGPPAASAAPPDLPAEIAGLDPAALAVMGKAPYAAGQWAVSVSDLETGEKLVSFNDQVLFEPGSVVKTYSMGAAWQEFGPDHRIVTPVKRTGEITAGKLDGDLVLVGMGDLTLGGRTKADGTVDYTDLDHNDANEIPGATLTTEDPLTGLDDLARQIKAAGIDEVGGDVVVDDRLWEPDSLVNGPISPIIVNQNLIDFTTTPGAVGETATVVMSPVVAPWTVSSQVQTVAAGGATEIKVSSPAHGSVVLSGTLAADSAPVVNVYAFDDPARFARTAFIEALGRAGVTVTADPVAENPVAALPATEAVTALPSAAELTSLSRAEETEYTLKVSYNRGAQTTICLLAVAAGSTDCTDGLTRAQQIWSKAGLDTTGAVLIDGSGLTGNLVTTENAADLHRIMGERDDADRWRSTLPILGVDGSLALVLPKGPAAGKVQAKTGTLGAFDPFNQRLLLPAKALSGYIEAASGRQLVFAVIASDSVFSDINGVFAANDDVGKIVEIIQQTS